MHDYDVAVKNILTQPGSALLAELTGRRALRWINVETPKVSNRRVDLLGEAPDGQLIHIELQSRNQKDFPLRMADYRFGLALRYKRLPRQVALYVGRAALRMRDRVEAPDCLVRFDLVDIRDLDGERLLESPHAGDNVMAILTRFGERPGAVRMVLERISAGDPGERELALAELLILAGLRKMVDEVEREAKRMPIQHDIRKHPLIGPWIREGRDEGLKQGLKEGRNEGQRQLLLDLVEKRFGKLPAKVRKSMSVLEPDQLRAVGERLLSARRLEDLRLN